MERTPLSEEIVESFEKEKGIKLPKDYHRFITTLASAGTQPFYGLYSLIDNKLDYEFNPIVEKVFPYTIKNPFGVGKMTDEEYAKFFNDDEDTSYMQGYFCYVLKAVEWKVF